MSNGPRAVVPRLRAVTKKRGVNKNEKKKSRSSFFRFRPIHPRYTVGATVLSGQCETGPGERVENVLHTRINKAPRNHNEPPLIGEIFFLPLFRSTNIAEAPYRASLVSGHVSSPRVLNLN